MSAWSKKELGWVTPTIINISGSYTLNQACDSPDMIMITYGFPDGEYLLIENRQPCKFDSKIPQGGLAIFHIDENVFQTGIRGYPSQIGWPANGNHYKVALLQADAYYDLETDYNRGDAIDLFHAGYMNSIGPNGIAGGALSFDYPNTNAYQDGDIIDTGILINNVSASASSMTLDIIFPNQTFKPSTRPSKSPIVMLSPKPSTSPTSFPSSEPSVLPSSNPSISPSSILACTDSTTYTFGTYDYNGATETRDCAWITANNASTRRNDWCSDTVDGAVVGDECPVACQVGCAAPTTSPTKAPTASPTMAPSVTMKPSAAPTRPPKSSMHPSTSTPTSYPNYSPSVSPSYGIDTHAPSQFPVTCSITSLLGRTFYFTVNNACWQLGLFGGGSLSVNREDPTCANDVFVPTTTFSLYETIDEVTNIATYTQGPGGFSGTLQIKEAPNATETRVRIISFDSSAGQFVADVIVPSCESISSTPSLRPTQTPSIISSNKPSTKNQSLEPSPLPTESPVTCSISSLLGRTFYFTVNNACWQLGLFGGGSLSVNREDPTCANDVFVPTTTFSLYETIDEVTNIATYTQGPGGFSGTLQIKEAPNATETRVRIISFDSSAGQFVADVIVPSC